MGGPAGALAASPAHQSAGRSLGHSYPVITSTSLPLQAASRARSHRLARTTAQPPPPAWMSAPAWSTCGRSARCSPALPWPAWHQRPEGRVRRRPCWAAQGQPLRQPWHAHRLCCRGDEGPLAREGGAFLCLTLKSTHSFAMLPPQLHVLETDQAVTASVPASWSRHSCHLPACQVCSRCRHRFAFCKAARWEQPTYEHATALLQLSQGRPETALSFVAGCCWSAVLGNFRLGRDASAQRFRKAFSLGGTPPAQHVVLLQILSRLFSSGAAKLQEATEISYQILATPKEQGQGLPARQFTQPFQQEIWRRR